ncbi:lipid A deacylase LpxR family protein, partial [Nonomuraea sp. MG754425]|uniref:lipid A deacylase LpxR family protein n=1 Tax=Nonomuraea sp. MG754425 TaxID=2570319 RepID=UPI001F1D698F
TVPAGGTATATVTVDHRSAAAASYTGSLVASSADGAVRLTTPIGLVLGEQLHKLTIRVIHSGKPRGWLEGNLSQISPP